MHDPSPAAVLDDVEVVEGGQRILGPVCWRVEASQRWVVLGPNGAGKSTLVRLVGGWRLPTRGKVTVLGAAFGRTDLRALRTRIGWVSDELDRRLQPTLRVRDVVLSGRHARLVHWRGDIRTTIPEQDAQRVTALLDWVGAGGLVGRRFHSLSDGERQRVLLARALLPEPDLLLLDEPFAGLDLAGRELLLSALSDLASDPAAPPVVLVTHHAEDVPPGFTHGLLLRSGQVVAEGPLDEVLADGPLSATFDLGLRVEQRAGRYATRAVVRRAHGR